MELNKVEIGLNVVRSKGDYVVGNIGSVIEIDYAHSRARVQWKESSRTWVKVDVIEDANIPYRIDEERRKVSVGRHKGDSRNYKTYVRI